MNSARPQIETQKVFFHSLGELRCCISLILALVNPRPLTTPVAIIASFTQLFHSVLVFSFINHICLSLAMRAQR